MNIITQSVDIEKIHKAILRRRCLIGASLPYVICSEPTKKLIKAYSNPHDILHIAIEEGCITKLFGCTILTDNSLDLGAIDIR